MKKSDTVHEIIAISIKQHIKKQTDMKKTTFLSILIAISLQITAQDFAPVGSIWHYTQGTLNPHVTSFKTLESVADTVISGKECRKLVEVERYLDTVGTSIHYLCSENNSVFFYAEDAFH